MSASNAFNWIISPVLTCAKYIGDETVNSSILHKSVINITNVGWLLTIARQKLIENQMNDEPIQRIQAENIFLEQKAKELIASDFHSINSHALIGLWCAVETVIEDTLVSILLNDSNAIDTVKKIDIKIKNSIQSPVSEEDVRRVYSQMERQTRQKNRVGESYCVLLSTFGIKMHLDKGILDALSEINSVRNCLLHRGGFIDKKAAQESPNLLIFLDKEINISRERYLSYYDTVHKFVIALCGAIMSSHYITTIDTTS